MWQIKVGTFRLLCPVFSGGAGSALYLRIEIEGQALRKRYIAPVTNFFEPGVERISPKLFFQNCKECSKKRDLIDSDLMSPPCRRIDGASDGSYHSRNHLEALIASKVFHLAIVLVLP